MDNNIKIEWLNSDHKTDTRVDKAWIDTHSRAAEINVGFQGENVECIYFDYTEWVKLHGSNGIIKVLFTPPGEAESITVNHETTTNYTVMWRPDPHEEKKKAGRGKLQFVYETNKSRVSSPVFEIIILKNLFDVL